MIDLRDPNVIQTEDICMRAVQQNEYALKYVKNQTEAICTNAVKIYGSALRYVKKQTEAMCIIAIDNNAHVLEHVRHQTEAICMFAVKRFWPDLLDVRNQTDAICMLAVKRDGNALKYVKNQTDAICMEALLRDDSQFLHIYDKIVYPSPQLITRLLKLYPQRVNIIMTVDVYTLMDTYKICRDALVNIAQHSTDLLYRPNNVNMLVGQTKWHTTATDAKTLFLTQKN